MANVCHRTSPVCVDEDLGATLPVRRRGTTAYANDDHVTSCGGGGTPDRGLLWTAPRSGTFTFDTARSAMDSLLCLRRDGCAGEELACATEGISYGGGARVSATLEAGQRVLVVVDGATWGSSFSKGDFELHIHGFPLARPLLEPYLAPLVAHRRGWARHRRIQRPDRKGGKKEQIE